MADLLLPATAELLDGWRNPCLDYFDGGEVIVLGVHSDHDRALCLWLGTRSDRGTTMEAIADLRLDLARAECRDRVARVVLPLTNAGRSEAADGCLWGRQGRCWFLFAGAGSALLKARPDKRYQAGSITVIPALADLDPNDDTRLADGSRLVDAQALLVVAMAVFNGQ